MGSRLARTVLICAALVALTPILVQTASALNVSDPDYWIDVGSAALYMGDTYEVSGYTVKFVDYQSETDQVYISLWRGDEFLNESVLNASCVANKTTYDDCNWLNEKYCCDCFNWNDEIAIEIHDEIEDSPESRNPTDWENPLINIVVHERAKPEISLEIETNCEAYTARDSEIRIKVTIENDGENDADLKHVDLTIDPGDLHAIDDLTRHYTNLVVDDDEKTFHTKLRVPSWVSDMEGELFEIVVSATGFDEKGVKYTESASTEVLVLPRFDLTIRKTVNSHISMNQTVWVRIDLENIGKEDLDIELNDTVPEGFRLCGNESPPWRFSITPSERVRFSYHIEPVRPGVFEIPGAEATFVIAGKNVNVWSSSRAITVDGAYIIMNKTAYPTKVSPGDPVTVTLNVRNTGNADAVIDLTDVIPSGASLISGDATLHATLSGNQSDKIEYIINFSVPGNITLAPPEIVLAASDHSYVSSLGMPTIEVTGSLPEEGATPPEEAGAGGAEPRSVDVPVLYEIALMLFMLCVVYLIGRFR